MMKQQTTSGMRAAGTLLLALLVSAGLFARPASADTYTDRSPNVDLGAQTDLYQMAVDALNEDPPDYRKAACYLAAYIHSKPVIFDLFPDFAKSVYKLLDDIYDRGDLDESDVKECLSLVKTSGSSLSSGFEREYKDFLKIGCAGTTHRPDESNAEDNTGAVIEVPEGAAIDPTIADLTGTVCGGGVDNLQDPTSVFPGGYQWLGIDPEQMRDTYLPVITVDLDTTLFWSGIQPSLLSSQSKTDAQPPLKIPVLVPDLQPQLCPARLASSSPQGMDYVVADCLMP